MKWDTVDIVVVGSLGLFFGFLIGGNLALKWTRADSIAAGVAEYYLDSDYDKQFRFITNSARIKQ